VYNLNYVPTTWGVQSWREIICGGTRTKQVEYLWPIVLGWTEIRSYEIRKKCILLMHDFGTVVLLKRAHGRSSGWPPLNCKSGGSQSWHNSDNINGRDWGKPRKNIRIVSQLRFAPGTSRILGQDCCLLSFYCLVHNSELRTFCQWDTIPLRHGC
jgi:hypothetical protein